MEDIFSAKYPNSKVQKRSTVDRIVATFEKKIGLPKSPQNGVTTKAFKKPRNKKKEAKVEVNLEINMNDFQRCCAQEIVNLGSSQQTDCHKSKIMSEYCDSYMNTHQQEVRACETKSVHALFEKGVKEIITKFFKDNTEIVQEKIEFDANEDDIIDQQPESSISNMKEEIDIKQENIDEDVNQEEKIDDTDFEFKEETDVDTHQELLEDHLTSDEVYNQTTSDELTSKIVNSYSITKSGFINTKQLKTQMKNGRSEGVRHSERVSNRKERERKENNVYTSIHNISAINGNIIQKNKFLQYEKSNDPFRIGNEALGNDKRTNTMLPNQNLSEAPLDTFQALNEGVIRVNSIKKSVIVKNGIGRPLYVKNSIRLITLPNENPTNRSIGRME